MMKFVKKEDRYETKEGEEFVVVPKEALEILLDDYYEVSEGLMRDDSFIPQETIDKAIEELDTGLELKWHDVNSMQTMFNHIELDDVDVIVENNLAGTLDEHLIDEVTESMGELLAKKPLIESEGELNILVHKHLREVLNDVKKEAVK